MCRRDGTKCPRTARFVDTTVNTPRPAPVSAEAPPLGGAADVPDPHRCVEGAARQELAVGREGHAPDLRLVPAQAAEFDRAGRRPRSDLSRSCRLADVAVHESDVVRSRNLGGLGHFSGIGDDVETAFDKRFDDARADALRSSGHDGCLPLAAHGRNHWQETRRITILFQFSVPSLSSSALKLAIA